MVRSTTIEKICPNCGEILPNDSKFCVNCGTKIENIAQSQFRNLVKKISIIAVGIVVTLLIIFIVNSIQAANLKKELLRDWLKVEGEDGSYIQCILDFSENEIEYRLETGYSWMDTTVATYDYKVLSGNKIKVNMYGKWEVVTVEFNEEKTMMTVSPALTSVEDEEHWFNLD